MKVSVTLLEHYRFWRENEFYSEETEQRTREELIAKIRGQRVPLSEPARRGIAFARVVENPNYPLNQQTGTYDCDGYQFDAESFSLYRAMIPHNVMHEVWLPWYYVGDDYLVGRADCVYGNEQGDAKLVMKSMNAKKYDSYEESLQWQAYLLMADMPKFTYYVAHGKERRKDDVIVVDNFHTFSHYRTPATDKRVIDMTREFARFAEPYLQTAA